MKLTTTVLMMTAALGLAACKNPDRYAAGSGAGTYYGQGGAGGAGGMGGAGVGTSGLGDPSNPASVAYFNQTIGDRVLFPVDQSSLTAEARAILTQQAQWLNRQADRSFTIEGHADEQGTREYNLALGARRANAVEEFLISQGVSANRMRTVSYGKERPIAVCSTEECYAQNRRAVTVISAGGV